MGIPSPPAAIAASSEGPPPSLLLALPAFGSASIPLPKTKEFGAGDGNRTHIRSLEGSYSTIELRPRRGLQAEGRRLSNLQAQRNKRERPQ